MSFVRSPIIVASLAVALASIPTYAQRAAEAQGVPVIHVGASSFEANAGAYYALENGFFKQAGLNVDVQPYNGAGAITAAVAGGTLQIGIANPLSIAVARQRGGLPFVIVAPAMLFDPATNPKNLVVAPSSTIRSGKAFDGTTVAVSSLGGVDALCVLSWIDAKGGDAKRVKLTEMPQSLMGDAVFSGRIAAAAIADPANSAAVSAGKVRPLDQCYVAFGKSFLASSWFAKSDWADKNVDTVRRFRAAIDRAGAWATQNPVAAAVVLNKYMNISEERTHEVHARSVERSMLQPILDLAAKYNFLDRPMDSRELIWTAPEKT